MNKHKNPIVLWDSAQKTVAKSQKTYAKYWKNARFKNQQINSTYQPSQTSRLWTGKFLQKSWRGSD